MRRLPVWTLSCCFALLLCLDVARLPAEVTSSTGEVPAVRTEDVGLPADVSLDQNWQLEDSAKTSDSGPVISSAGYHPQGWDTATVPGTVLSSLVNDGIYPEPLYGENNRPDQIPDDLCRTSYWYRTQFILPRSYSGRFVQLNFQGINYAAEVWLNGIDLGPIRGAFARGVFDVTPTIYKSGPNTLAVLISPPPDPGVPNEKTVAAGTGRNGGILAEDGPTFLCTIGWDWIPGIRDRDMGLWQGVSLSAHGPVTIEDPYVTTSLPLPRTDSADITIQTTVRNVTDSPQTIVLKGAFSNTQFQQHLTLYPHESRLVVLSPANTPDLHILHPLLWWPNGYGLQNLYTLFLTTYHGDEVEDRSATKFGIRTITYSVPGSDNLTLVVNGVPVIAKGGDWGMDEAMKRIPYARLDAEIRMHKLANYTIIRNWVGQSTSPDFYDLCDKYGLLVWDEFFQPNPGDGPNPLDDSLYLANVREKILRFRSHPCIALWCGRNEGSPPPVIDQGIQAITTALDPNRLYQPSSTSGHGVLSHGPYYWRPPQAFFVVDAPFKTEIGSISVPTLEAIHAMMPPKDWSTVNDDWAEHDFTRGAQGGNWYVSAIGQRYGTITDTFDFVRKAQLANYEAFRAMYEGRFAQLFDPVTGVMTWMSNPAQPSFVWQLYSHDLEPNASFFAVRKACEPVHIQLNADNWHVMIINATPDERDNLTASLSVYHLDGTLAYSKTDSGLIANKSAATDLGPLPYPCDPTAVQFVKLKLLDEHGALISDNFYWRAGSTNPYDLTALDMLPTVTLSVLAARHDIDGRCCLNVSISNPTRSVALMAHLQLRRARSRDRVLPSFYSDNYVSLLPGESKTITVDAAEAHLDGEPLELAVDGWNVTVHAEKPTASMAGVIPNVDAFPTVPGATPAMWQGQQISAKPPVWNFPQAAVVTAVTASPTVQPNAHP